MSKPFLAIDGNNILVRAIKAAEGHGLALSNHEGTPTAPLVIFVNAMSRYVREVDPGCLVVCWDGGRSAYRTALYPAYKGQRAVPEADEADLKESAFALAKEFLSLAGFHHVVVPGYEADDLIANYWQKTHLHPMVVLSGDKDLLQLMSPTCTQIRPGHPQEHWDPAALVDKHGCRPEHWGIVLALAGDAGDGVPGVPRVGIKTACKDLSKFGWSLDTLIEHGPERYRTHRDEILRNVSLVELRQHAAPGLRLPDPPPFTPTDPGHMLWDNLLDFLRRYDLDSIRSRAVDGALWCQK